MSVTADSPEDAAPDDAALLAALEAELAPPRFPVRRDVELAADRRPGPAAVPFYDRLWLSRQELAVILARVNAGGEAGHVRATGVRALLRAALSALRDPAAALARLEGRLQGCDVALLVLDSSDGRVRTASLGAASLSAPAMLAPGGLAWAGIGLTDALPAHGQPATPLPLDGPEGLLRPVLDAAPPGSAAAALLFKLPQRAASGLSLVVPNDPLAVAEAVERLEAFCAARGLSEAECAGLAVALDELLTNAVSYAFDNGRAHELVVEAAVEDGRLLLELRDDGRPFDPLRIPPPDLEADLEHRSIGGLGVHFVRTLLDRVDYAREKGWNVLRLEKRLDPAAAAADATAAASLEASP